MSSLLFATPWLAFMLIAPLFLRRRPRLRDFEPASSVTPLVSIIVPARNEALNIGVCAATLFNTSYPKAEIIMVDDASTDATGDIARALAQRSPLPVKVVNTEPLLHGWVGKSWACWTGYQHARGELLLFTDADTRHDDELLPLAVGALQQTGAALITVLPRQLMESFWERVVLPHVFLMLQLSFGDLNRMNHTKNPRRVIANGQFMLVRRDAYERLGGHQAVQAEVCEDLVLARRMVAAGNRMLLLHAPELMETRMYHSLGGIVEGWSKNLARGAQLALTPLFGRIAIWVGALLLLAAWVAPIVVLAAGFFDSGLAPFRIPAATIVTLSLLYWALLQLYLGNDASAAIFFPLGALVTAFVMLRSALRGNHIRWRGRDYRLPSV